jgi:hypothetical protein
MNDKMGHYFQTKKGLRQGDPSSPILFNLIVDKSHDLFERLVPHLVVGGLSIL